MHVCIYIYIYMKIMNQESGLIILLGYNRLIHQLLLKRIR
jgi:hypothetical protein